MWRLNPISERRYEFIVNYVRKKIRKEIISNIPRDEGNHSSKRKEWILQETERRLKDFAGPLSRLGEADPTASGQYCNWIVDLIFRKNITPEDFQKVRELLEVYHKVKRRLPVEHREIKRFTSYHQLRTTLLPMLPSLKSVGELRREGMQLLHSDFVDEIKYDIYQLLTPEAASKAAQNTGWCVCNIETAKNYMDEGPLYLIFRNDERFILAHMEPGDQETIQVMDVNDVPLHLKFPMHYYREIVHLFAKYLPQFLCKEHSESYPLFPTVFKTAFLYNLICENVKKMVALRKLIFVKQQKMGLVPQVFVANVASNVLSVIYQSVLIINNNVAVAVNMATTHHTAQSTLKHVEIVRVVSAIIVEYLLNAVNSLIVKAAQPAARVVVNHTAIPMAVFKNVIFARIMNVRAVERAGSI